METAYPHLTPVFATVAAISVLPSGAAFAVRLDDGSSCYIPLNVAQSVGVALGDDFTAKLVPNRFARKPDRAPWLAVHIERAAVPASRAAPVQYAMPFEEPGHAASPEPVASRVRDLMRGGDVWTVRSVHDELGGGASAFTAIHAALQSMFSTGECAKFAMWRSETQRSPAREWYTCYPDRADVAEWEADE